jgi:hypothetical protein
MLDVAYVGASEIATIRTKDEEIKKKKDERKN